MLPKIPAGRFTPLLYQPGGIGNWSGHLPFAHDLVTTLRPELIVELGTHYGESYFGFCQSVQEEGLSARCYAVDTWEGETHAGYYGEDVFAFVNEYNAAHYAGFSYLLRTSFDRAAPQFGDASIDLLHIDGLHTYGAVSSNFHSWAAKVKPGGVILLHDIAARHSDFGVWKFWEEVSAGYPSFAFHHSWGLGVILVPGGSDARSGFVSLLAESDVEMQVWLRYYYSVLAENLEHRMRPKFGARQEVVLKIYPLGPDGHSEFTAIPYHLEAGVWQHVQTELTSTDAARQLRIDPCEQPAILDILAIRIRSAVSGEVLWAADEEAGWDAVQAAGTLRKILSGGKLRWLSYGADPILMLPQLAGQRFDQPLRFEMWLRIQTDLGGLMPILDELLAGSVTINV